MADILLYNKITTVHNLKRVKLDPTLRRSMTREAMNIQSSCTSSFSRMSWKWYKQVFIYTAKALHILLGISLRTHVAGFHTLYTKYMRPVRLVYIRWCLPGLPYSEGHHLDFILSIKCTVWNTPVPANCPFCSTLSPRWGCPFRHTLQRRRSRCHGEALSSVNSWYYW